MRIAGLRVIGNGQICEKADLFTANSKREFWNHSLQRRKSQNVDFQLSQPRMQSPAFGERRGAGFDDFDFRCCDKAYDAEISVLSTIRDGKPSGFVQAHRRDWVKRLIFMAFVYLSVHLRCAVSRKPFGNRDTAPFY